ncbi:MAG: glycosyltransferase family 8 protein [Pseudomonadaceae bacterium]|nr:glycosyltransferase family 8 protein [Pseudomonadaceae bacterium]
MSIAFATLVTNSDYARGARALARSLIAVRSTAPLLVMATPSARQQLSGELAEIEGFNARVVAVDPLPVSEAFRCRHERDRLHSHSPFTKGEKPAFHTPLDNFCKLRLWQQTEFERIVFLDADTLVVRNIDQLFDYPEFSAAPNLYETLSDMHRLNSGVFVAQPSDATFDDMLRKLDAPQAYWRRTDQTFLETYFPRWHGLPYTFNALQYVYFNLPELWDWDSINVVHYQYEKPWQGAHARSTELQVLTNLWHQVAQTGEIPQNLNNPAHS